MRKKTIRSPSPLTHGLGVERFFAWIGRIDGGEGFEATIDSALGFLYAASVMLLLRRIAGAS